MRQSIRSTLLISALLVSQGCGTLTCPRFWYHLFMTVRGWFEFARDRRGAFSTMPKLRRLDSVPFGVQLGVVANEVIADLYRKLEERSR